MWMNIFDIGLLTSLRNRVTESISFKDWETAKKYTSTTYALLAIIIIPIWLVFFILSGYLNWQSIFYTNISNDLLQSIVLCVFTSFCLQFLLKPINSILTADQKHTVANGVFLAINVLSILFLVLFKDQFYGSLYAISILFGFMPCLVLLLFSVFLFSGKYKMISPSFRAIDFKCRKDLLGLGFKFFVIQIAGLVILSSNNFIISHFLGNEQVTYYNIVLRYFSVITIGYSLVNAPFWTAYTDAYALKDWFWIKKMTRQANYLCTILLFVIVIMLLLSSPVYKAWINSSIEIPFMLSALVALNIGITLYANTYISFINGTGKLRLQSYLCIVVSLFHIPIAYMFVKAFGFGLNGLVVLTTIWSVISLILWSVQYKKILNKSTGYIWN